MPSVRTRRLAVAAMAAGSFAWAIAVPVADAPAARARVGGVCAMSGTVSLSPGIATASNTTFNYALNVVLKYCGTSDKTIKSGSAVFTGSGKGGCLGYTASGNFSTSWNNGKQSYGTFTERTVGPVSALGGKVTSGEFEGIPLGQIKLLAGNYLNCGSTGLLGGSVGGFFRVGAT